MSSRLSEGSRIGGSRGSQRLWPYADLLLPLLPTDIDPDQAFCVEVPWSLRQEIEAQSSNSMRRRTDEPARRVQLGCYIPDRSQARSRPPGQRARPNAGRQIRLRLKPTCLICLETSDTDVWIKPTARCMHGPVICTSCLREYIIHKVVVEGLATLICPDPGCRRVLEHGDVVKCIEDNTACLDRYHNLIAQMDLEKHPNFIRCTNSSCGRGQVHSEGAAVPVVTCEHCHARSCFRHQVPWHLGLTCEQYTIATKHKQENHASEEYIARHAKRCPNPSCRRPILKNDGCDHMTCCRPAGCGHEFCWACLADYGPIRELGNHHHGLNCPHYSGPRSRGQVPTLEVGRPPRDHRTVRAAATRERFPAPARPPFTPAINHGTIPRTPGPRLLPVTPLLPAPVPRPSHPSVQPNVNPGPPRRPTLAPVPASPVNVPVISDPGPVSLPAPPLIATRSPGRRMRPPFRSVKEEIPLFGKAPDILSAISSVTWWPLVYLILVFVGLILRAGETKILS